MAEEIENSRGMMLQSVNERANFEGGVFRSKGQLS